MSLFVAFLDEAKNIRILFTSTSDQFSVASIQAHLSLASTFNIEFF